MKRSTELLIMGVSAILMASVATCAFADTISQTGSGNHADQNSNNSTIGSYNTTLTSNSNNPHVSAHSDSTNINANTLKQHQSQGQLQNQSADNNGNHQKVEVVGDAAQKRNPVSTAFAAPLAVGSESCMGSTSAGGQGVGFGLSLGSTWHDEACERRKDAAQMHNMGQKAAALALMCQNENVAAAMATAGTPCPGNAVKISSGMAPRTDMTAHASSSTNGTYPSTTPRFAWAQ